MDKIDKYMSKATLSYRFRQALKDRIEKQSLSIADKREIIAQLVLQKQELEKERDATIKVLFYSLFGMFFLSSGSDFIIPFWKMKVSDIPSVLSISIIFCSVMYLLLCLKFVDIQAYGSAISVYSNEKKKKNEVDHLSGHVERMRHDKTSSWYEVLNSQHSLGKQETFVLRRPAKIFGGVILIFVMLLVFGLLLIPVIYLNYVTWTLLPRTVTGWTISLFTSASSFVSILIICIELMPFKYIYSDEFTRQHFK